MTEIPRRRSGESEPQSPSMNPVTAATVRATGEAYRPYSGDLLRARGAGGFFERVGHAFDDRFPGQKASTVL